MDTDLSEFVANLLHELRNPLNGILGFTEFLLEEKPGPLNPRQKEYLGDVLESGRLLLQLINDVADLSKLEAGQMPLLLESFSLRVAIAEAVNEVAVMAADKGIVLQQLVAPGLDRVTLDRRKVLQILCNLLSTAVTVTGSGEVCIRASAEGSGFAFQVSDCGVDSQSRGKLFAEYQQLAAGGARRLDAIGLRLALTRGLVELQRGQLRAASREAAGTTVTVNLPLEIACG